MKSILLFALVTILGASQLFSQTQITGVVTTAEDGTTLPGVTILAVGSFVGATTDVDGRYSISVPTGTQNLKFSYLGYKTIEVPINNQTTINVVMETDFTKLDEIVVIGYGTATKESLTGSVQIVRSDKFEMTPITTMVGALQGNVSGLQMVAADGQPGAASQVRIRGIGSINASSEPLYVIDGIPMETGSFNYYNANDGRSSDVMSTINPNDIATMSILKDASATAIYGSRGANGVILITTKSGQKGEAKIEFNTSVGFSDAAYNNLMKPVNASQYRELFYEGFVNQGLTTSEIDDLYNNYYPEPADTRWMDEITQKGVTQQYNLSASGGNEKMTYFASVSYFDQEGWLINTGFERFSSRLNLTANLTDKLTLTNNISIGRTNQTGTSDGSSWDNPVYGMYLVPPQIPVYDNEGLFYADHVSFMMGGANPVGRLLEDTNWTKQLRIIDNISASYKILDNLTFKTAWSFDLINASDFEFENGRYGDGRRVAGRAKQSSTDNLSWIGTQTLNYHNLFFEKHNIDIIVGYEAQNSERNRLMAYAQGFPNPTLRTLASAATPTTAESHLTAYSFASMFSRVTYDFENKYFASASYRRDGSSRFGIENRWGDFWSAGVAWKASSENFLSDLSWLDNLRFRMSYGVTGNADIGALDHLSLYGFGRDYYGEPGSAPSNIGNPLLTWESQSTLDIGIDLALFNRFNATVTYFRRANTDLLLNRPLSLTTGFSSNLQNVGDLLNTGFEIDMDFSLVKAGAFLWTIGANITTLRNEITKLDEPIISDPFRREQGRDYYEYFMWHWAGVDPDNGDPLWYTDESESAKTNNINDADRYYTGKSSLPKWFGGFNTLVSYKGFSLSAQTSIVWDKWTYDGNAFVYYSDGRYTPRSQPLYIYENRWQNPGDITDVPRFEWGNTSKSNQKDQTRYLYDATHIRLRDVTLTYQFPPSVTSVLRIASLKIYMKGTNMLTWVRDNELYLDPEMEIDGTSAGLQPQMKTMSVGISASF